MSESYTVVKQIFQIGNIAAGTLTSPKRLRILVVTSHSLNNDEVFLCSLGNHQEYCTAHGYDLLSITEAYDPRLDIDFLTSMLNIYDVVVTLGTDIFITDMNVELESFLRPGKMCCIGEDGSQLPDGWHNLNGDFIIFRRPETEQQRHDFARFLHWTLVLQREPQIGEFGFQNVLNIIFHPANKNESADVVQSFPPRVLQSASPYNEEQYQNLSWHPGDFCCHFNLLSKPAEVRQKITDMRRFLQEYGDRIIHCSNPLPSPKFEHCPMKSL